MLLGLATWGVLFGIQIGDVLSSLLDLRGARDSKLAGRATRRRFTEYVWTIPGSAILALGLGLGVDFAGRLIFDDGEVIAGVTVMIWLVVFALLGGAVIVFFLIRGEALSYALLRANLAEDSGQRLTQQQVDAFRAQLADVDKRRRRIRLGYRDRTALAGLRTGLENLADAYRVVPPTGLAAFAAIGARTANSYLWRGNLVRLVPVLVAFVPSVSLVVLIARLGDAADLWVPALFLLLPVISYVLAVVSARATLASKVAWHAVHQNQRDDVVALLDELDRSARKGVAGLGDRVARALQILRDQQG